MAENIRVIQSFPTITFSCPPLTKPQLIHQGLFQKPLKALRFIYPVCEGQIEWWTTRRQGFRNSPKSFVCNLPPVMWISNCSQKAMVFSDVLRSWDGMIIKSAERKKDREKECEQSKGLIKCHYPSGSNPSRRPWTCGLSQTAQGSLTHVAPLRARRPIHLSNRYSTRVRRGATPLFIPYLSFALFVQSSLSSPRFHPRPLSRR